MIELTSDQSQALIHYSINFRIVSSMRSKYGATDAT